MGVKMKGVYSRKDIEFKDTQAMMKAYYYAAQVPPWTIRSTPEFKAEYLAIYGADEEANLKEDNLVQSSNPAWVKGGVFVPADPKPPTKDPLSGRPGEVLVGNMTRSQLLADIDTLITSIFRRENLID